uniref:Uncharacterized protein n=1 Tax=Manihot esculenta TaxID=3983 RepID=A0A2C9UCX4_MANES
MKHFNIFRLHYLLSSIRIKILLEQSFFFWEKKKLVIDMHELFLYACSLWRWPRGKLPAIKSSCDKADDNMDMRYLKNLSLENFSSAIQM